MPRSNNIANIMMPTGNVTGTAPVALVKPASAWIDGLGRIETAKIKAAAIWRRRQRENGQPPDSREASYGDAARRQIVDPVTILAAGYNFCS
jgi:hypothetical protein